MTLKKYQIGKHQAMMEYMDFSSRNSPPFMRDENSKWTNINNKHTHHNWWLKEGQHWPKKILEKEPAKKTRLIRGLPMMWKMQTAQIREEIYFSLTSCGLFPEEIEGCYKGSRGSGELYIDQHILNESKTRRQNLAMAWIDYKMHIIWS